jgi:hypothetical protein
MREEVQYDGVDFSRLAPVAWIATFGLAFIADAVASQGHGVTHVRMQTMIALTLFAGLAAMAGTAQWARHYLDTGRPARAWLLATGVLCFATLILRFFAVDCALL